MTSENRTPPEGDQSALSSNNDRVTHSHTTAAPVMPSGAVHPIAPARLLPPKGRPDLVAVGTWIWLASDLMFFAALFAA